MRIAVLAIFGGLLGYLTGQAAQQVGWWVWFVFVVIVACFFGYAWLLLKEFQDNLMVAAKKGWREEQKWK